MRSIIFSALCLAFLTSAAHAANFTPIPQTKPGAIQVSCDQRAASSCQRQANGCGDVCKAARDYQLCWQGCLNRYKECKYSSGCGSL